MPRSGVHSVRGYLRGRIAEVASATTRATSEPLADWAVRRIRLAGRPFTFDGHEYLRAIYDDTAQHVVLIKAAQIGGTTWAILRAIHACAMGLTGMYFFPTRTDVLGVLEVARDAAAPGQPVPGEADDRHGHRRARSASARPTCTCVGCSRRSG